MLAEFKSLPQLFDYFKNEETCLKYWEQIRWGNNPTCPHCGTPEPYMTNRGYKCTNIECQKKFTSMVGSIFENSKIPLRTWFAAIYLISGHKKGISSMQIARDLAIHQKSAWFLLHRIREALTDHNRDILGGEGVVVEVDATVVGGKVKNMNNQKRKEIKENQRGRNDNKTNVLGIVERCNSIRLQVMRPEIPEKEMLIGNIDTTSVLMTDSTGNYNLVGQEFAHHGIVDHSKSEYVKDKIIHTNTLEGAFSLFDRMVIGIYHNISKKHMQAYCNESAYRYNTRKGNITTRFEDVILRCSGVRLTYNKLIGK